MTPAAPHPATAPSGGHAAAPPAPTEADKDRPLVEDIRLLGRLLGDVIREQAGQAAFDLIEQIRQLSVAFLFAETIRRISDGESVTSLFAEQNSNF